MSRIVYISDSAIPSASPNSIHVMKMCQAMADHGHAVTLYAKTTTACFKGITDVFDFYGVRNNFNTIIFPKTPFRGSGLLYNTVFLPAKIPFIKADLVYTRSVIAAFLLLLFGKSCVYEMHEPFEGKGRRLSAMFSYVIRHRLLRKIVVISAALRDYLVERYGLSQAQIVVAHDGADPFVYAAPALTGERFKVGYVGSLYQGKGMEILQPLAEKIPEAEFHIVGGNEGQISFWKKKNPDLANLIFHGFKSQKELPSFVSSFDVLIAPYTRNVIVSDKKGANNLAQWMSPLKLFEYMSAGKPIVTTDLPVIREVLQDEKRALLCQPDDLDSWTSAIKHLKENREIGKSLGEAAKRDFLEKYTWFKRSGFILKDIIS